MFSNMHNSMAPPQVRRNSAELLSTGEENLAAASPSTKRRVLLPPNYQSPVSNANTPTPAQAETHNPLPRQPKATPRSLSTAGSVKEEIDGTGDPGRRSTQKNKGPTIPLPDYDTLYPKRIHGIQGQIKWDHIVAEVTQRQRDYPPELIGKEVSVDEPSNRQDLPSSTPRDRSALPGKTTGNLKQAESEEGRFSAFKRMGSGTKHAFTPPKRTTAAPEKVKQDPSTRQVLPTVDKPNDLFAARVLGATTPKVQNSSVPQAKPRLVARDEKKVLNTSVNIDSGRDALPKESQWTPEKVGRNSISAGGAHENPDNQAKEVPSITPRQRPVNHKSGKVLQMGSTAAVLRSAHEDPSTDTAVQGDSGKMEKLENSNVIRDRELFTSEQTQAAVSTVLESRNMPKQDLFEKPSELFPPVEKVDDDPFPSEVILAKDPWALPVQSFEGDDLFTGGRKREVKPDEAGMTTDDMEKLFGQKDERDPFSYFDHSDRVTKFPEQDKTKDNGAGKHTPGDQRASSSKKSRAPLPPAKLHNTGGAVDPFSPSSTSSPLPITSSLVSPEPLKAVAGDVAPQPSGTSGGKAPLRAWVSPSEAQAVAGQSRSGGMAVGKGGEPASTPRRPHPVKPMSSLENQAPASISLARDIKSSVIRENVPEKMKVSSSVESGPYSQLTQDELISLVVKQQDELSKKNGKILELEDYIDNLLVHVIEEKPSILLAMANTKKAI